MEKGKVEMIESLSRQIQEKLGYPYQWSTNGRFTRFNISLPNLDSISISVMYHENQTRRFRVVKNEHKQMWFILDIERNVIVKDDYKNLGIANAVCEKYNKYHENQGWDQFKNRTI